MKLLKTATLLASGIIATSLHQASASNNLIKKEENLQLRKLRGVVTNEHGLRRLGGYDPRCPPSGQVPVRVAFWTDTDPEESSLTIVPQIDPSNKVWNFGPFTSDKKYADNFYLCNNQCYFLSIHDEAGDGMEPANFLQIYKGWIEVYANNNVIPKVIGSPGRFGSHGSFVICVGEHHPDNACDLHPCQNGGTCNDDTLLWIKGFQCDCSETGYEGALCEVPIDDFVPFWIRVKTDSYPQENYAKLFRPNGDVYTMGPFGDEFYLYEETLNLPKGCGYKFVIYDSWGDGINPPGYYELELKDQFFLHETFEKPHGSQKSHPFCVH